MLERGREGRVVAYVYEGIVSNVRYTFFPLTATVSLRLRTASG